MIGHTVQTMLERHVSQMDIGWLCFSDWWIFVSLLCLEIPKIGSFENGDYID